MKQYHVATYYHPEEKRRKLRFMAYLRDYSPDLANYRWYFVQAPDGPTAKRLGLAIRELEEAWGGHMWSCPSECSDAPTHYVFTADQIAFVGICPLCGRRSSSIPIARMMNLASGNVST